MSVVINAYFFLNKKKTRFSLFSTNNQRLYVLIGTALVNIKKNIFGICIIHTIVYKSKNIFI